MADQAGRSGVGVEEPDRDLDPAGRHFEAVIAGQAWHRVDRWRARPRRRSAAPGGRLAVFWNSFLPPPELNEAMAAAFRRIAPDTPAMHRGMPGPDGYSALCAKATDGMRQAGGFGEPEQWRFDWARPYSRDEWLDQVPTFGGFSRFPPATQQALLAGIGAAVDALGGNRRWATPRWRPAQRGSDPGSIRYRPCPVRNRTAGGATLGALAPSS